MMAIHDYLRVDDLDRATLLHVLDLAAELKTERNDARRDGHVVIRDVLRGRTVATIFEKPSLRTRVSFELAIHELGGHAMKIDDAEIGLGRRETIADTGRVLAGFVDGIVLRTFGHDRLDELAEAADVPVVNALCDLEHPCQALADLQAVREEFGALDGVALTYVGDGNNVAHSLLLAGALAGMDVRVAHPAGYAPDDDIVGRATTIAADTGATVTVTTDLDAAVAGTRAVYTDVWASMGQEEEAAERARAFAGFQVTDEMMAGAADDAIFLHCLPAHRGEEVAASVIDGPRSRVFGQAENRLHAQKALLHTIYAA